MNDQRQLELTDCEREPIHTPGAIQAHGVLVVLQEPGLTILQVSVNSTTHFGLSPDSLLGQSIGILLGSTEMQLLQTALTNQLEAAPHYLTPLRAGRHQTLFEVVIHRYQGSLFIEFEAAPPELTKVFPPELYTSLKSSLAQLQSADSLTEFCQRAVQQVRRLTGYDRVMVYQFLPDGSGSVLAEDKAVSLEPYLGLHYPASDIPQQARALYLRNWLRLLPDNEKPAVALAPMLHPVTKAPTDLSHAALRSMSPVHAEYLRNMGVRSSMSLSILSERKLWGLIACHHRTPLYVPHDARVACEFLAFMLSLQMAARETQESQRYAQHLNEQREALFTQLAVAEPFYAALRQPEAKLLDWITASGAALCFDGQIFPLGQTPAHEQLQRLSLWLGQNIEQEVFATDQLATHFAEAAAYTNVAAGLLAIRLGGEVPQFVLWFRPEVVQTINWAGNPQKPMTQEGPTQRLTPRQSFALWVETVRGKATPWLTLEIDQARALRRALQEEIIKRQAQELCSVNAALAHSNAELDAFAYIASHDLKEPLRGIRNYSQFLLARYNQEIDEAGTTKLATLVRLSKRMENLLDALLEYSRTGRVNLNWQRVNLQEVLDEALESLETRIASTRAQIRVPRPLPTVLADQARIGEVFLNLISNALKYNDKPVKFVEIGWLEDTPPIRARPEPTPTEAVSVPAPPAPQFIFYVRDNGIGIPAQFRESIFDIFARLHGRDEYGGGVGAGLTIVRKIIERHGDQIWLESEINVGTTFFFTLSKEFQ